MSHKMINISVNAGVTRKVVKTDSGLYVQRLGTITDDSSSPGDYGTDPGDISGTAVTVQAVVVDSSLLNEYYEVDSKDRIFDTSGNEYVAIYYPATEVTIVTVNSEEQTFVGKHPAKRWKG